MLLAAAAVVLVTACANVANLAKDASPDVDPIGRTIRSGLDSPAPMTIVGIAKSIRTAGPTRAAPELFMPYEQHQGPATSLNIVIRTDAADPLALCGTAARQIRERNPEVPVRIDTMDTTMARATATPGFRTLLLAVFAAVALLLAIAGVYGVMAYTVNQRVPEIGLRVALGASPADVMTLVLKEGALLVVLGLAALTALGACLVPGRRALRVDPLRALRGVRCRGLDRLQWRGETGQSRDQRSSCHDGHLRAHPHQPGRNPAPRAARRRPAAALALAGPVRADR